MRAARAAKDLQEAASDLSARLGTLFEQEVNAFSEGIGSELSADTQTFYSSYLRQKVLPLLTSVTSALCLQQPSSPTAFLALLLAEQLVCPGPLLTQLRSALPQDEPESGKIRGGECKEKAEVHSRTEGQEPLVARTPEEPKPDPSGKSPRKIQMVRPEGAASPETCEEAATPKAEEEIPKSPRSPGRSKSGRSMSGVERSRSGVQEVDGSRIQVRRLSSRKPNVFRRQATFVHEELVPELDQIVILLRKVPMMSKLKTTDLERVAAVAEFTLYDPDETIVNYGQRSDALHIVVKGCGQISVPQPAGILREGDFMGEESLQAAPVRASSQLTAAGAAGTVVQVMSISRAKFEELGLQRRALRRDQAVKGNVGVKSSGELGAETRTEAKEVKEGHCAVTGHKLVEGYTQTADDRAQLVSAVKNNKVLAEVIGLTDEQCGMLADAVHLVEIESGKKVFRKGDVGNAYFIVFEGLLKVVLPNSAEVLLRTGDTFGELALMYDEPRSATVATARACRLWVLPRPAFKEITQIGAKRKFEEYAKILSTIPALAKAVDPFYLNMLPEILEETTFRKGDAVCVEGEDEGELFIIFEGSCSYLDGKGDDAELKYLHAGDWAGEEQLVGKVPAARTLTVSSERAAVLVLNSAHYQLVSAATKDPEMRKLTTHCTNLQEVQKALKSAWHIVQSRLRTRSFATTSKDQPLGLEMKPDLKACEVAGALGEGSFGLVLLLRDKVTKKEYALKCLTKAHLKKENQETMVQNERNVMTIMDSIFIVRLYRAYEDTNFLYLMLEVVMGGELFDVFSDNDFWGRIDLARFYVASVSIGLAHMHGKKVIWRDLKLENCLLDSQGYLKLTDMGIAKHVVGKTYTVCGTVDYFAPETLKQVGHNRGADWWAMGVLLFIMLAGRSPFEAPEVPQIYKNIIKGLAKVEFPKVCTPEAEDLIKGLCKKKPEDRITMQKGGVKNLKAIPFFEGFNWEDLAARKMTAPFVPDAADYDKIAKKELSKPVDINWEELEEWEDEEDVARLSSDRFNSGENEEEEDKAEDDKVEDG